MMRHATRSAIVLLGAALGSVGYARSQTPPSGSASTWKQIAYLKASTPSADAHFGCGGSLTGHAGNGIAISRDGTTIAVGAPHESSAAKGINGNQNDTSMYSSGAVYVFTRRGGAITQQAYIKAASPGMSANFGSSVALSTDGNTLAVAAYYEASKATGINGDQDDRSIPEAGAVYVFTRSAGKWSQQAYIKASNTGKAAVGEGFPEGDQFGYSMSLSADGNTLVVGAIAEDSNAKGIDGNQADDSANQSGAVYVFVRNGAAWTQQAYVKSSRTAPNVMFGYSIGVSADGNTMAVGEFDADRGRGAIYVLTRSGATWSEQARLQSSNAEPQDSLGYSLAISDDGNTIAGGAADEDCMLPGINPKGCYTNDQATDTSSGAAYIFVRSGAMWSEQAYLKASNPGKGDWFGVRIAVSGDGNTVVVGAQNESAAGKGINSTNLERTAPQAGAVYVFRRSDPTTWVQDAYVKGSNTEGGDEFGSSISLTRDGRTLIVGARGEDSGAKGLNGNQADNSVRDSGAAYLFTR